MTWKITPIQHNGTSRLKVEFENIPALNKKIRSISGALWSSTLKSWHLPDTVESRTQLNLFDPRLELSKTEGLSEETKLALTMIKNQVREDEKRIVIEAYQKGYHDKEMSRRPTWNYCESKYKSFFTNFKVG